MTGFDDRQKAFDAQFAHDSKMDFEMEAKISKAYGLWAASELGLENAEAAAYATSVVEANLDEPGFDDILRKVRKDFQEKGLAVSDHAMESNLEKVIAQIRKEAQN